MRFIRSESKSPKIFSTQQSTRTLTHAHALQNVLAHFDTDTDTQFLSDNVELSLNRTHYTTEFRIWTVLDDGECVSGQRCSFVCVFVYVFVALTLSTRGRSCILVCVCVNVPQCLFHQRYKFTIDRSPKEKRQRVYSQHAVLSTLFTVHLRSFEN